MAELFDRVREACSPAAWSRGVELARSGAVVEESADEEEIRVRVDPRGGLVAPRVYLFLDDGTWDCECPARDRGCEHVAAAVIARRTDPADAPAAPGRIVYRLSARGNTLCFGRGYVRGDRYVPLETRLELASAGRAREFLVTQSDLAIEIGSGGGRSGPIPPARMPKLLALLARCDDLTLDGDPIEASAKGLPPVAAIEDCGDGFRVTVGPDPRIDRVFENGAVRVGRRLHPTGESKLSARERDDYTRGKVFVGGEIAKLVSEVLPGLEGRARIDVRTVRLPAPVQEPPRLSIELRPAEDDSATLEVLATLVYGDPPRARVDGGRLVHLSGTLPIRDEGEEKRLTREFARTLHLAPGVVERLPGESAVAFVRKLEGWPGEIRGDGRERFSLAPPIVPSVAVSESRGRATLDVAFEPEGEGDASARRSGSRRGPSAEAVIGAWRRGESLVELPDGGWSPLPADWLSRYGAIVADLLSARGDDRTIPPACQPDVARLCDALDLETPPATRRFEALLAALDTPPDRAVVESVSGTLRPYQEIGAGWLARHRDAGLGAILADDMGLGKTVQALAAFRGRVLVVCPTSVLHNWRDETGRFRPDLRVAVYHGPTRKLDGDADVTLTSYALLRLDEAALAAVPWDAVVLDEAQAIKNPESRVARAACRLEARSRIALSGTPVENRLDELWSLMRFANPGLLGTRSDFQDRYVRPVDDGDEEASRRLRARIRPFLLRRLKRDVAPELPPRTDAVLWVDLDEEERRVYEAVRVAARAEVERKLEAGSVLGALEALLRLRQAACHRALLPGQEADASSKIDVLTRALDTVRQDGHRALVFSQWTALLDRVEPRLRDAGLAHDRLDGSTRDRGAVVARFQADDGPTVLLVSLKAGGTGLNLTAADHVFLLDPWWNPAVEDQAADRAHRIGQERPVMVYRLVAADTVEEKILALQERKREVASVVTEGAGGSAITREDVLALLR